LAGLGGLPGTTTALAIRLHRPFEHAQRSRELAAYRSGHFDFDLGLAGHDRR
jgi:hypothetical protein